jgi:hypothetical protein
MGSIKRLFLALVAAGATSVALAAPAQAGLLVSTAKDCADDGPSARVFQPWLDLAQYVPAPGGHAESAAGWTFTGGARVVAGNEPWKVGDKAHRSSLLLPAGSSATTATMCVGLVHPTMRFFAKRNSGTLLNPLIVEVQFEALGGVLKSLPIGVVLAGGQWQPTLPSLVVANLLPLLPGAKTPVRFKFTPVGRADWQIDDVYVDPWRSR